MNQKVVKTYLFTRYERFWHWLQMVLIFTLLLTGFEVNGFYSLMGFKNAVDIHNFAGLTWLIAFLVFVFWLFTTGEWRQYIPTTQKLFSVALYYAYGIFRGDDHPYPKRKEAKHNPLQRLSYLGLSATLLPVQMLTGFLYWSYNSWEEWGLTFLNLQVVAFIHIIVAFAILQFVMIHVYLTTTTGHTPLAHIKTMITGWEDLPADETAEEWEIRNYRNKMQQIQAIIKKDDAVKQ